MTVLIESSQDSSAIPLTPLTASQLPNWLSAQAEPVRRWVEALGFVARPVTWCAIPADDGGIARVLSGVAATPDLYALSHLPLALPDGAYRLDPPPGGAPIQPPERDALGFALGAYAFTRYRAPKRAAARLVLPPGGERAPIERAAAAVARVRDLVNTPTEDMGPAELEAATRALGDAHGARVHAVIGDELLAQNFPAIHAVGRASHRAPRLIALEWGDAAHPRIAIIGKGVCFDTGGLDIKPPEAMRWMKKDMGGAAHAIALAGLVMGERLPVRLQLLVPAVENAIGPNAFRPGEVIRTRAGMSVEIDNTDAEGRVVLGDALACASESNPVLMLDFATLTGAARIALGPELPALFSNRDEESARFHAASRDTQDPVWPMPLWKPYGSMLDSIVADFANSGPSRMAGAITAALYLDRFVPPAIPWLHLDTYAWNEIDRPGRPRGGEALGMRAAFEYLRRRFA
ncbi:MAG TPA: leucyl aminopeptidase family protein [Candidatus Saccharimonadia bacterium]|nr:leucyl aminopeptidase family protein [Candidatus Saccharimonadia bacterium]